MTDPSDIIHSDPEIFGGTPVFRGTHVPARTLLEYLAAGDPLDNFTTVSREQAVAVLDAEAARPDNSPREER